MLAAHVVMQATDSISRVRMPIARATMVMLIVAIFVEALHAGGHD